jgi:hypothetical protein
VFKAFVIIRLSYVLLIHFRKESLQHGKNKYRMHSLVLLWSWQSAAVGVALNRGKVFRRDAVCVKGRKRGE